MWEMAAVTAIPFISTNACSEIYLPPFQACFEEGGASSVMTSTILDGSRATANDWLLNQLLKKRMGIQGFVISDASAVGGANVLHFTARDYAGRASGQSPTDST